MSGNAAQRRVRTRSGSAPQPSREAVPGLHNRGLNRCVVKCVTADSKHPAVQVDRHLLGTDVAVYRNPPPPQTVMTTLPSNPMLLCGDIPVARAVG